MRNWVTGKHKTSPYFLPLGRRQQANGSEEESEVIRKFELLLLNKIIITTIFIVYIIIKDNITLIFSFKCLLSRNCDQIKII